MIDTSGMSAQGAREAASVLEQALELRKALTGDIQAHMDAVRQGDTVTIGPLQKLKIECLARLTLLAEFHHVGVETMLGISPTIAINWAIDEATIVRIAKELARIDCDAPVSQNGGES